MVEAVVPTIFVHLQKTGGSTLRLIVRRQYAQGEFIGILQPGREAQLAAYVASPEARARVRAIYGHLPFAQMQALPIEARYITVLREPIARVVSHHAFAQRQPSRGVGAFTQDMTLEQFVVSQPAARMVHNLQTRVLSRLDVEEPVTRATLDAAKRNLERHFVVVGITERFDEAVLLMRRVLGWPRWPFYERRNVSPSSVPTAALPADVIASIRERNELDIELYDWAARRFDDVMRASGARARAELVAFRALNSGHGQRLRRAIRRL
ncbi:MAG: hypothetical protein QOI95_2488 [Acidimicrobiaceae bacterium]|jgi:hypothetical protein